MQADVNQYWDSVAEQWRDEHPQKLWRSYCNVLNGELIRTFLSDRPAARALKTDLFDEATSPSGLVPYLAESARSVTGFDLSYLTSQIARNQHTELDNICAIPNLQVIFKALHGTAEIVNGTDAKRFKLCQILITGKVQKAGTIETVLLGFTCIICVISAHVAKIHGFSKRHKTCHKINFPLIVNVKKRNKTCRYILNVSTYGSS